MVESSQTRMHTMSEPAAEKCDECVGYGQVDLRTSQQCCPCNGMGVKAKQEDKQ